MLPFTFYERQALGKFLKSLRLATMIKIDENSDHSKSLTQEELADRLFTKRDTISQIENGKGNQPTADLIARWVYATSKNPSDLTCASILAGHTSYTVMPTLNEMKSAFKDAFMELKNKIFPAYIIDHTTTIWAVNTVTRAFIEPLFPIDLVKEETDTLDFFCNSRFATLQSHMGENDLAQLRWEQIRRIKAMNKDRQCEHWYRTFAKNRNKRFGNNATDFEQMWDLITPNDPPLSPHSTTFKWSFTPSQALKLYFEAVAQPIFGLNGLFHLVTHQPINEAANIENAKHYLAPYYRH
jgi:transcriptional regulator with XRE-family HTH domain